LIKTFNDMRTGALLRIAYQEIGKSLNERVSKLGYEDIRTTHFPVLQPLFFNSSGMTSTELADLAGMTKQSMGELVRYLGKCGYVEKHRDKKDSRAWLINLTPKGNDLMDKLYEIVSEVDEVIAEQIGKERFTKFRNDLMALIPILQQLNQK
jgi:DNA-binding MarR family transcriptional regulator